MKLSDWAKAQGVSYITAYRWFKSGKLPVKAYQTESGTIIVTQEENMISRSELIPRVSNGSSDVLLNMLKDASSMFDALDVFAPTYWNSTKPYRTHNRFKTLNKNDQYIVVGEVPGFTEDEIKVSVKDNVLHVSGKHELTNEENNYFSKDTSSFDVMYTLPHDVDVENISADHKNGILEISVPKLKNEKLVKEIPIKRLKE